MSSTSETSSGLGKRRPKTKAYYRNSVKKKKFGKGPQPLTQGVHGILITTGDKEKWCVPEAYNLLNEYADKLYGPEDGPLDHSSVSSSEDRDDGNAETFKDIAQSLEEEVAQLKRKKNEMVRRFCSLNTGANRSIFIKCSNEVDPTELVLTMLRDVQFTQVKKSRYCQRILPVVRVCRASHDDISKAAVDMLEPYFHTNTTDVHTFAVNYKARNSNLLKRDDVIRIVASLVTRDGEFPHRVNFDNPELVIIVEIIRNLCCLAVVRDFYKLRRYNIQSLTEPTQAPNPSSSQQQAPDQASRALNSLSAPAPNPLQLLSTDPSPPQAPKLPLPPSQAPVPSSPPTLSQSPNSLPSPPVKTTPAPEGALLSAPASPTTPQLCVPDGAVEEVEVKKEEEVVPDDAVAVEEAGSGEGD